jgi:hypothetical protein
VATRSTHAASPSDASGVAVQVIGSVSAVRTFLLLVLARRTLVLLVSGVALRPLSLVVPRCPGVGLRSCVTRRCVHLRRQGSLLGVARSSIPMPIWTLLFSPMLH